MVNENNELLLFSKKPSEWRLIAGAVEANETIRDSAYRELREEAGCQLSVRAIGVVHAHSFHYDEVVRNMISIYYVMRYIHGSIIPGDDMSGAEYQWWTLQDLRANPEKLIIPNQQIWILERAVEFARKFNDQDAALEYYVDS